MDSSKPFTAADEKPYIKFLEFIGKQIFLDKDGKYHLNMHLDHFGPYAVNKQVVCDLRDRILHSLDASINFPG